MSRSHIEHGHSWPSTLSTTVPQWGKLWVQMEKGDCDIWMRKSQLNYVNLKQLQFPITILNDPILSEAHEQHTAEANTPVNVCGKCAILPLSRLRRHLSLKWRTLACVKCHPIALIEIKSWTPIWKRHNHNHYIVEQQCQLSAMVVKKCNFVGAEHTYDIWCEFTSAVVHNRVEQLPTSVHHQRMEFLAMSVQWT